MEVNKTSMDFYEDFKNTYVKMMEAWTDLHSQLSMCDKAVSDIEHVMELFNHNASQGFKLYKMAQLKFRERRVIKNKIAELQLLLNAFSFLGNEKLKENIKRIENDNKNAVTDRKYRVRVMHEVFGDMLTCGSKPTF
jgi:hypothetical protein